MKLRKITNYQWRNFVNKLLKRNFYVSGTFGSYEIKKQKNGLIKYIINCSDKSFDESTKQEILKQIERKGQIILMEGKSYITVMNPPQNVLEVV